MIGDPKVGLAVARWLRAKREEREISQRKLAEILRCHHSILGKIETEERRLEVGEFIDICRKLNLDPIEELRDICSATAIEGPKS